MTFTPERRRYWLEQGALHYALICLIALAVVYLDMGQRGLAIWALFPAGVGFAALLTRWAAGPVLLIVAAALAFGFEENLSASVSFGASMLVPDLVLASAVLAYVMAHNRLTLIDRAFPSPSQSRRKGPFWGRLRPPEAAANLEPGPVPYRIWAPTTAATATPSPPGYRPPPSCRLVSPQEVGRIIMAVPLWAIAAECCWLLLPSMWGNPGIRPPQYWRLILLAWIVLGPLLIAAAAFAYLRLLRQSPQEAALALQDVVWRETRREQRRISRWFAWAHVRRGKPAPRFRIRLRWVILILTIGLLVVLLILRAASGR